MSPKFKDSMENFKGKNVKDVFNSENPSLICLIFFYPLSGHTSIKDLSNIHELPLTYDRCFARSSIGINAL